MSNGYDPNQPRDEDGKWTDGAGSRKRGIHPELAAARHKAKADMKEDEDRRKKFADKKKKEQELISKAKQDKLQSEKEKKEYAEYLRNKRFEMNMKRGAGITREGKAISVLNQMRPSDTNLDVLQDARVGDVINFGSAGNFKVMGWEGRHFLVLPEKMSKPGAKPIKLPFERAQYIYKYTDYPDHPELEK